MKKIIAGLLIFLLLPLSACQNASPEEERDFFVWMDGYLAAQKGTDYTVALTYFYEDGCNALTGDNIASVYAGDTDLTVTVTGAESFEPNPNSAYKAYRFDINFSFSETGTSSFQYLFFELRDGTRISYPIGNWVLDVADDPVVVEESNFMNAIAASALPERLNYKLDLPPNMVLMGLHYGLQESVLSETGLPQEGTVPLAHLSAPVRLIRPRLQILADGVPATTYSSVCYCGALDVSEEDVRASKEYCAEMRSEQARSLSS